MFFREGQTMKALISERHAKANCVWCEKEKECVTVEFSDGFLAKNSICWRCLQKAVKVRSAQTAGKTKRTDDAAAETQQ